MFRMTDVVFEIYNRQTSRLQKLYLSHLSKSNQVLQVQLQYLAIPRLERMFCDGIKPTFKLYFSFFNPENSYKKMDILKQPTKRWF